MAVARHGLYLSHDGLAYAGTAANLLDGRGLGGRGLEPPPGSPELGNFPPLYPLVLATAVRLGVGGDPLGAAAWLNPAAGGAAVLLVTLLARRASGSNKVALGAGTLLAGGAWFLGLNTSALSEPLFLVLTLASLASLAMAAARSGGAGAASGALAALSALLAGAATMTRYVGVCLAFTGAVTLARAARPRRLAEAAGYACIALAPLAGWLAWVRSQSGHASNRPIAFHPFDAGYWGRGLGTASEWLLPPAVPTAARVALASVVAVVAVAAVAAVLVRRAAGRAPARQASGRRDPLTPVLATFAMSYLGLLAVDRTFLEVTGRLDRRFLAPLGAVAIVGAARALAPARAGRAPGLAGLAVAALVGLQAVSGGAWVAGALTGDVRPGGFASPVWAESAVIDALRRLPPDRPVYTNAPDVVTFYTGRVVSPLPQTADFFTGRTSASYTSELAAVGRDLAARNAVLVLFTATPARKVFLPTAAELGRSFDLAVAVSDQVGTMYELRGPP